MTNRILISACLLGHPVRYDGAGRPLGDARLARWSDEGRLVVVCPELLGGLGVPRPPAEILGGTGDDVLDGRARIVARTGEDVTAAYLSGAAAVLAEGQRSGCRFALLIDRSPSCGSARIYDGAFAGRLRDGAGVTAALLRRHGVEVFADHQIDRLSEVIDRLG